MMESLSPALDRVAQAITARIDSAFVDLEAVRDQLVSTAALMTQQPRRSDFSFLAPHFHTLLEHQRGFIEGAGIAYEPGSLADADHWIEWWRVPPTGAPRFISHDLNQGSLRFYDYSTRDWFKKPREADRSMAVGPYVDVGGINVNTVTLTTPATTPVGTHVLGCDVSLSALEEIFIQNLQTLEHRVLLVGPNARVITSNTADLVTGTLADLSSPEVQTLLPVAPHDPQRLPWQLVTLAN
jgi:hypothetical protein